MIRFHLVLIVFSCGKVFLNLMSGIGHPTFRVYVCDNHGSAIWVTCTPNLYDIPDFRLYQKIDHAVVNSGIDYDDEIGVGQIFFWCHITIFWCIGYDKPIGVISIAVSDVLSWYIWLEMLMKNLWCDANTIVRTLRSILGVVAIRIKGPRRWKGQPSQIGPHWIAIINCQVLITLWYFLSHN